ncbi:hypothetical protein NUU61_001195 [Penicillium alfredii]|uniref:Uncharacterized protein n=1 Tax=Penicillium alfredii TaxID=1506179 RepID=A0A9W9GB09_9EURO|nr:uncharacterized protein NUU61_001195 [Penicillium alfredii]KAJ5115436.1 hypothetical protein NUU61_001195 [Penicillium alfredii]
MQVAGQTNIVNLLRLDRQPTIRRADLERRHRVDIASSWASFHNQLAAGLNMGLAGIPWWTTDIGGFHGGNPDHPAFRELFTRWFQWGPRAQAGEPAHGQWYLVVPVFEAGQRKITAYLPAGASWKLWDAEKVYSGGCEVEVDCPIETRPVFVRV